MKKSKVLAVSALSLALMACGSKGNSDAQTRSAPVVKPVVGNTGNAGGGSLGTNSGTNSATGASTGTTTNTNSTGTTANTNTTTAINPNLTGKTPSNTTSNLRTLAISTDFKGNNEMRAVKPTGKLATELQNVLSETNRLRAEKGLPPLKLDEKLSAYAQVRAGELPKLFEHKRPDERSWNIGVMTGSSGENLAAGTNSDTGAEAVEQWRTSTKGHYEAIINPEYSTIGIGVVYVPNSQYKYYWVQIFGDGRTQTPYSFTDTTLANNADPLNKVIVNGVEFSGRLDAEGRARSVENDNKKYNAWVNGYASTRFGAVKFETAKHTSVFYQGYQTPESAMPKSGTATYNGRGMIVTGNLVNRDISSQFNVNFGNKTLTGTLKHGSNTLYNLSADIKGSSFVSKAGTSVATEGAFFGNNASELAGIFTDTKTDTKGAFAAKK